MYFFDQEEENEEEEYLGKSRGCEGMSISGPAAVNSLEFFGFTIFILFLRELKNQVKTKISLQ